MNQKFDENSFWNKVTKRAKKIGKPVVEIALMLFFCLKDDDTPIQAKSVIVAALAYFVLPLDLVADFLPAIGYTDDLAALPVALMTVTSHIKPEHKEQAAQKLEEWFAGEDLEKTEKKELKQYLRVLLIAMIKVQYKLETETTNSIFVVQFTRKNIASILRDSPSLQGFMREEKLLKSCYKDAAIAIRKELKKAVPKLPKTCEWDIEEILYN